MYRNIINTDHLAICEEETNPYKIRISWFKDNHFLDEAFINLAEPSIHNNKPLNFDGLFLCRGECTTFYCDAHEEWLIVDVYNDEHQLYATRIYNLKELYEGL